MTVPKISADGFNVVSGSFGFVIVIQQCDFPPDEAGNLKAQMVAEIRMSPRVAKALMAAIVQNVGKYEDENGEIVEPSPLGKMN